MKYVVCVVNGLKYFSKSFNDETEAKQYRAEMLVKYPRADVELLSRQAVDAV